MSDSEGPYNYKAIIMTAWVQLNVTVCMLHTQRLFEVIIRSWTGPKQDRVLHWVRDRNSPHHRFRHTGCRKNA